MYKAISSAFVAALCATSVDASTLNGSFSIDIYQRLNSTTSEASATLDNLAAADTVYLDTITYTGNLDFGTYDRRDRTTIGQWLASGVNGVISGLDSLVADLQLSRPDINRGRATATFFDITANFTSGFDALISHDDGISLFDDGVELVTSSAPTEVINSQALGFDGGEWRLLYVATNGDPSVLRVTGDNMPTLFNVAPVPVPAGMPLVLIGLSGFALLRRRQMVKADK